MKNFRNCIWCYSFVLFSILLSGGSAQKVMPGPCKDVNDVASFDYWKYLGDWYEIARSPREFEDDKTCMEFHFKDVKRKFVASRLYVSTKDGKKYNDTASVKLNRRTGEGETTEGYPFVFLDIDYKKYAVVYACRETGGKDNVELTHQEISWVNTRETLPDVFLVKKAFDVLKKNGIDTNTLITTNRLYCPTNFDDAENVN